MKTVTDGEYSAPKNDEEMVAIKTGSLPGGVVSHEAKKRSVFRGENGL